MIVFYTVGYYALMLFSFAMWGRLVLDLSRNVAPHWRPRGALLVVSEIVFAITDRPIRWVRKFVRPISFGGMALDLAWSIVMLVVFVLMYVITALI